MRVGCLIVATCACGRIDFTARPDAAGDSATDGDIADALPDSSMLGPWGTPDPVAELATASDESDPELRADGLEIIFHSLRGGGEGLYDLYSATRTDVAASFGIAQPLANPNTAGDDMGPSLTADGLTLIYGDGADIVYSTRGTLSSPFSTRIAVPQLSSTEVDTAPEISRDGKVAIVARGVGDAREMWIYTRAADGLPTSGWDAGRQLTELSSAFTDTSAELDEKGLTVYFHSNRVGTFDDDLYVATRASTTDPFGAPVVISELQTSDDEGDPTLSADGRILVFHRNLDLMQSRR